MNRKSVFKGPNFGFLRSGQLRKARDLRGMERLLSQGGFIQDVVEEEMEDYFPQELLEIAYEYGDIDKGFWDVLEAMDRAVAEMQDFEFSTTGERVGTWSEPFREWYVKQSARVAGERAKNEEERFWNAWDLSRDARRVLQRMPVLDERVLFLRNGLDGGEARDAAAVAQLPEFEDNVEFVEKIFTRLELYMKKTGQVEEEFGQACDRHRQEFVTKSVKEKD